MSFFRGLPESLFFLLSTEERDGDWWTKVVRYRHFDVTFRKDGHRIYVEQVWCNQPFMRYPFDNGGFCYDSEGLKELASNRG